LSSISFQHSDSPTLKVTPELHSGSASQYEGSGQLAQKGWQYLNPALATSSMLFREINRDTE